MERPIRKRRSMTTQCIHGFPSSQCMSCRTCQHGQTATNCSRCRAATTARKPVAVAEQPSEDHAGFEIYYEPAVSGWRYRSEDASPSTLSYRSAFLARKAVDSLPDGATSTPEPTSKRGSKRRS